MRYPISHRGASFGATEHPLLVGKNQARPVGVTVGPDSAIYVAIAYMAHNEGSPIYASDLVRLTPRSRDRSRSRPSDSRSPSAARRRCTRISPIRPGRLAAAPTSSCCDVVATRSNRRPIVSPPTRRDDPAYAHLIWLTAAAASNSARERLVRLAGDGNDSVRLQAIRALHDFFSKDHQAARIFASRLTDANPQVVLAATVPFFDASPVPLESISRVGRPRIPIYDNPPRWCLRAAPLDFLNTICSATTNRRGWPACSPLDFDSHSLADEAN